MYHPQNIPPANVANKGDKLSAKAAWHPICPKNAVLSEMPGRIPEGKETRKQVNVKYLKIFDYEYQTISRQSSG